jgi:hypothetical protein
MSFGKITVLKKDGVTEGSTVDIKKEITIGRLEENMHYFLKSFFVAVLILPI